MNLTIYACARKDVSELKEDLIHQCQQGEFGGWSYKYFSLGEEAIYKSISGNGTTRIVAFVIEEEEDGLVLSPAQMKGDSDLSFNQFSNCFGDIVNLLINNLWKSIEAILIKKRN